MNLIDLREQPYRWAKVMAVVESATKNNEADDSDQVPPNGGIEIDYAERCGVSVRDAVLWAERMDGPLTLYLYDQDEDAEPPNAEEGAIG